MSKDILICKHNFWLWGESEYFIVLTDELDGGRFVNFGERTVICLVGNGQVVYCRPRIVKDSTIL